MSDDEVRAICAKLLDEFRNELKDVKSDISYLEDDVTNLGDRVTALENMQGPKVTGWVNYRIGFASSLENLQSQNMTPNAAGQYWTGWRGPIQVNTNITDNVNQFDNLTAKIGAAGNITDDLVARVILKVRDTEPAQFTVRSEGRVDMDTHAAEQIWLDEANLAFNWDWAKSQAVVGRQFQSYGLGVLVNNARQSQQGVRLAWNGIGGSGLNLDTFVGGATYTFGWDNDGLVSDPDWPEFPGDGYISARLGWSSSDFAIAGNYLADGFGNETGWGGDIWAKFWGGRELQGEYATMTKNRNGYEYDNKPWSIMANVDIWKGANWALKGYYSIAEAKYSTWYSTVNPYLEEYGQFDTGNKWVNWGRFLDNPLILPNVRTIGGTIDIHMLNADWQGMYYNLDNVASNWTHTNWDKFDPSRVPYNNIWAVRVKKEIASGVTLNLTYAQQLLNEDAIIDVWGPSDEYASDMGWEDVSLLMAGIAVGF